MRFRRDCGGHFWHPFGVQSALVALPEVCDLRLLSGTPLGCNRTLVAQPEVCDLRLLSGTPCGVQRYSACEPEVCDLRLLPGTPGGVLGFRRNPHPGGVPNSSRGLSAAIPPEPETKNDCTLEGCQNSGSIDPVFTIDISHRSCLTGKTVTPTGDRPPPGSAGASPSRRPYHRGPRSWRAKLPWHAEVR